MQLRFFDYIVLIVAFMFVTLRGDNLMKLIKFDKLSGAIPLNRAGSSALLHGLLFVFILVVLNALAAKIAGSSGTRLGMTDIEDMEAGSDGGVSDVIPKKVKELLGLDSTESADSRGQPKSDSR